jgi:hypothetical protein
VIQTIEINSLSDRHFWLEGYDKAGDRARGCQGALQQGATIQELVATTDSL